jgi:hypothetical protein
VATRPTKVFRGHKTGKVTMSIGREPIEQKFLSASTLESQSVLQHPRSTEHLERPEGVASESFSRLPPRVLLRMAAKLAALITLSHHKPTMLSPTTGLPSFSWETGSELPTLMDLEKMVDERGFEPPASSLRTVGKIS